MLEYCVWRFSCNGYGYLPVKMSNPKLLINLLQLTLNESTCLSLKAEGKSLELASLSLVRWLRESCPGPVRAARCRKLEQEETSPLLGSQTSSLGAVVLLWELLACAISSAAASWGLQPSHTLRAFRLLCHSICWQNCPDRTLIADRPCWDAPLV